MKRFKVIVIGLGVQGRKRLRFAGDDAIGSVDPVNEDATWKQIEQVPLENYDAALVCTPDKVKFELISYLLRNHKHVLVEKPMSDDIEKLEILDQLANKNNVALYTAYNHRFEPHFVRMKNMIDSGKLGEIYRVRLFYGNGTAYDVRQSAWRDQGNGVLDDLGSHLLDTLIYWFGNLDSSFYVHAANQFENRSYDHFIATSYKSPLIDLEMTLLSWRNHFTCDILAENGSAHIDSLCKWGPSSFIYRKRRLPSGRPDEEVITLVQQDPTWEAEYSYFKQQCNQPASAIMKDIIIKKILSSLAEQAKGVVKRDL